MHVVQQLILFSTKEKVILKNQWFSYLFSCVRYISKKYYLLKKFVYNLGKYCGCGCGGGSEDEVCWMVEDSINMEFHLIFLLPLGKSFSSLLRNLFSQRKCFLKFVTNRTLENWKTFPPYQIHPNSCSKWCWESNLIILVLFKNPKIYDTSELIFLSIDGTKIMTCLKALLLRLSSIVELVIHDSVQSQFSNLGCFRCVSNS